jgi:hypothetical protein
VTNRTVTLPTSDHGDVTLPEPAWCVGHADHQPGYRADILHLGSKRWLGYNGQPIGSARIFQGPCAARASREVEVSVVLSYEPPRGLDPAELYDLAAALESAADQLRDIADELTAIRAGGGQ